MLPTRSGDLISSSDSGDHHRVAHLSRAPITALALVIYIAAWALMIGATEIALAIKMRREIKGEWLLILMGLASIVFAALLLWNPVAGAAALIWISPGTR